MLFFLSVFDCFHCNKQYKKQRKFNITPYGENFIS